MLIRCEATIARRGHPRARAAPAEALIEGANITSRIPAHIPSFVSIEHEQPAVTDGSVPLCAPPAAAAAGGRRSRHRSRAATGGAAGSGGSAPARAPAPTSPPLAPEARPFPRRRQPLRPRLPAAAAPATLPSCPAATAASDSPPHPGVAAGPTAAPPHTSAPPPAPRHRCRPHRPAPPPRPPALPPAPPAAGPAAAAATAHVRPCPCRRPRRTRTRRDRAPRRRREADVRALVDHRAAGAQLHEVDAGMLPSACARRPMQPVSRSMLTKSLPPGVMFRSQVLNAVSTPVMLRSCWGSRCCSASCGPARPSG